MTHRQLGAVSLSWALGALASILLCLGITWLAVIAWLGSFGSGGPWWAPAFPAILLAQAGLCLSCAPGWLQGRPILVAAAVVVLTAAHAAIAASAWAYYSSFLWMLWIGPVPMLIPALIQFAAAAIDAPSSRFEDSRPR